MNALGKIVATKFDTSSLIKETSKELTDEGSENGEEAELKEDEGKEISSQTSRLKRPEVVLAPTLRIYLPPAAARGSFGAPGLPRI